MIPGGFKMHHFFEAITNTSGQSLIGYFARVIDPGTLNTVTLSSDDNGTPIITVSGVANMGVTDEYGNLSFYVEPGTYHLDIYASDSTTFVYRVSNVPMNSSKGDKGDQGEPGEVGAANSTYQSLAALKAAPRTNVSYLLQGPNGLTAYAFVAGDFSGRADDVSVVKLDSVALTTGALVRSVSDTVNVKDFPWNAKGNGTADDTQAIQGAINYVAALGGGRVWIPQGIFGVRLRFPGQTGMTDTTYLVALRALSNVSLMGPGTIRLLANDPLIGPGSPMRLLGSDGVLQNVTIEDLTFDYNIHNQSGYLGTNVGDRANGGTILLGAVSQTGSRCDNINISRVRIRNGFAQGIQVVCNAASPGSNLTVSDCVVEESTYIGIQFSHIQGAKVSNNDISNCLDNGIDFYGDNGTNLSTGKASVVFGNRIKGCLRGIFPETYAYAIVTGNLIDSCEDAGIHVNRIVGAPVGMLVDSNIIINTPVGIRATGEVAGIAIRNNEISGFGISGVQLGDNGLSVSYVLIEGNIMMPSTNTVALISIHVGTIGYNFLNMGINYLKSANANTPTLRAQWFVNFAGAVSAVGNRMPVFIGFSETDGPDLAARSGEILNLLIGDRATIPNLSVAASASIVNATLYAGVTMLLPVAADNASAGIAGVAINQAYVTTDGTVKLRTA